MPQTSHSPAGPADSSRKPARRVRPLRLLALLAALLLLGVIAVWSLQRMVLFPRHMIPVPAEGGANVAGLERLFVAAPEGPVEGWFLPGDNVSSERPGPALIFAHGNGELIDHWPQQLEPLRRLGISLLLPEFRGYGRSAGSPSEEAIEIDMRGFYDLLAKRPEVDAERIVFVGRSLGGGAVCALARHQTPRAMILMSTFTGVAPLARGFLVPGFLVRDRFDNRAVVAGYEGPLLLVHGRRDELVPFAHAEQLKAVSKTATLWPVDAGHNDCPPSWQEFFARVETFLKGAGVLP